MLSIQGRLLLLASLVLAGVLGLGSIALERALLSSLEQAEQDRLLGQVYGLLAAADEDPQGRMRLPEALPDPRLANPDSGLYAVVKGEQGSYLWRSPSSLGREFPLSAPREPGQAVFDKIDLADEHLYRLGFSVSWADDQGKQLLYHFSVYASERGVVGQMAVFRRKLVIWLGGVALILLMIQAASLRWGLRPLRQVARDLGEIERGSKESLQGRYPKELSALTHAVNSLIRHNAAVRERYRNSLGDLAHSLKTPLALLQGALEQDEQQSLQQLVREQVPRMNEIVQYQLRRAAAAGGSLMGRSIALAPVVQRLLATLDKVYRDKGMEVSCQLPAGLTFQGDEGDLMELVGNLLENAFKYGEHRISVDAMLEVDGGSFWLEIGDDGPGIPADARAQVIHRGKRLDQNTSGQGIGLSVAADLVDLYRGELRIEDSLLGGALIRIRLPTGLSENSLEKIS